MKRTFIVSHRDFISTNADAMDGAWIAERSWINIPIDGELTMQKKNSLIPLRPKQASDYNGFCSKESDLSKSDAMVLAAQVGFFMPTCPGDCPRPATLPNIHRTVWPHGHRNARGKPQTLLTNRLSNACARVNVFDLDVAYRRFEAVRRFDVSGCLGFYGGLV